MEFPITLDDVKILLGERDIMIYQLMRQVKILSQRAEPIQSEPPVTGESPATT